MPTPRILSVRKVQDVLFLKSLRNAVAARNNKVKLRTSVRTKFFYDKFPSFVVDSDIFLLLSVAVPALQVPWKDLEDKEAQFEEQTEDPMIN
eukprot:4183869-Amphidinium_carterae.1